MKISGSKMKPLAKKNQQVGTMGFFFINRRNMKYFFVARGSN